MDYLLIVEDTDGKVLLNEMQKRGETLAQLKARCSERFGKVVSFEIDGESEDSPLKEEEELDMVLLLMLFLAFNISIGTTIVITITPGVTIATINIPFQYYHCR